MFKDMRSRPFLVVKTISRPAAGIDTKVKGWADRKDAWTVYERVSIEDRVSDKSMREATVVVDILGGKCVKNRFGNDDNVAGHYMEKYKEECKKGIDVWITRQAKNYRPTPEELLSVEAEVTEEPDAKSE